MKAVVTIGLVLWVLLCLALMCASRPSPSRSGNRGWTIAADSGDTASREIGATPTTRSDRAIDSLTKPLRLLVRNIDTTQRYDPHENFFSHKNLLHYLLRDSAFVFEGDDCIEISGSLGKLATDPDTIFFRNTCASACSHTLTIPLGWYDTVSVVVWEPVKRWHCDSLCTVQIGRVVDTSYVLIPDSTVQAIKTDQLYTWGSECVDARLSVPKVCLRKRGSSWFGNLRDVDSSYQWKTCPSGACIDDSTCCVRYSMLFSYILSSRYGPTITRHDSTYVAYDTETLLYWNGHCDEAEFPRAKITVTPINCDSVVDSPKVYLKSVWHSLGRDTTITIIDCSLKCPVGRVKTATVARYDTTWRTEPVYENTIIGYDTTTLTKNEYYQIIDSVSSHYVRSSSPYQRWAYSDFTAYVAAHPGAIYDTVQPSGYFGQWRIGRLPVIFEMSGTILDPIPLQNICTANQTWWDNTWLFNYNSSSGINVIAWLDSADLKANLGCRDEGCSIDRIYTRGQYGYKDCYEYAYFKYTCRKGQWDTLTVDSVRYMRPSPDSVCGTVINPIYRLDSIGTRTWAEVTTVTLDYPIFTFEIWDSCGVDNIVNLCPTGNQPFRIGTTWYIDAAPCSSIPDVSDMPTNGDIGNLLERWKAALSDTLDLNPRSGSGGSSTIPGFATATFSAVSEVTIPHPLFLTPFVSVTAYRTYAGKKYQISQSDIISVQSDTTYTRVKFADAETGEIQVNGLAAGTLPDSVTFASVSEITIPRVYPENKTLTIYRIYNGKYYQIPQADIVAVYQDAAYIRVVFADTESGFAMLTR